MNRWNTKEHLYIRRELVYILASVMIFALAVPSTVLRAFNESEAVNVNPGQIEMSTLAIGTHLIYLESLDSHLYEIAMQTAQESGQLDIYYKSELNGGAWYEISSALSLDDIMKESARAKDSMIGELFFTYHTKSDGVTYKLKTDEKVSVFDIPNPYDPNQMPELLELRNQWKLLDKSGNDCELMKEFFRTEGEEEKEGEEEGEDEEEQGELKTLDSWLAQLGRIREALAGAGILQEKLEIMKQAMEKVDAQRRFQSMQGRKDKLDQLIEDVSAEKKLSGISALMEALGNCLKEVQASIDKYDGKRLAAGDSVLSQLEYELVMNLISAAEGGQEGQNQQAAQEVLSQLANLYHIADGVSTDAIQEKKFLDEFLIPKARAACEQTGSISAKNELSYYEKLRSRLDGVPEGDQELAKLHDEKEQLQEKRLQALEQENLAEAARLEELVTESDQRIQELHRAGVYGDGSASKNIENMKSEALGLLDAEAPGKGQAEAEETASLIQTYIDGISALCQTNPTLAGSALKELYEKMASQKYLQDTGAYDAQLEKIEESLAEQAAIMSGTLDEEALTDAIENVKGASLTIPGFENLRTGSSNYAEAVKNAAALAGLSMFCDQARVSKDSSAMTLLKGKAAVFADTAAPFVFRTLLAEPGSSYAPADCVANIASYRYIWNENKKEALLARGSTFYSFTAFQDVVERSGEEEELLSTPTRFQSTVYLPGDYVLQNFQCEVYDLSGTGYAVLVDKSIAEKASEVCDALLQKGEG